MKAANDKIQLFDKEDEQGDEPPMEPLEAQTASPAIVRRHAGDPHSWDVQLPGEKEPHVVDRIRGVNGNVETYCTCQAGENLQENLQCSHACAVKAALTQRGEAASARRERGLTYTGERTPQQWQVYVREGSHEHPQEYALDPRPSQALRNHSPDGFSWSYQGSGPAQLALAILLDYSGDEELALTRYQEFKRRIVAALAYEGRWEIHPQRIDVFLAEVAQEVAQAEAHSPQAAQAPDDVPDAVSHDCRLHDEIFPFSGYFGRPAQCHLRWLRRHILGQEKIIAIVTELPTNTGTSVTNRIEHIAETICRRFRFDPQRLILIEHYPDQRSPGSKLHDAVLEEHFSLISCYREGSKFTHPQWTSLTKKQVETLLGQPLHESSD